MLRKMFLYIRAKIILLRVDWIQWRNPHMTYRECFLQGLREFNLDWTAEYRRIENHER